VLGLEKIWSRQTKVTILKGHNFLSDRWIALKFLQFFPEAVFWGLDFGNFCYFLSYILDFMLFLDFMIFSFVFSNFYFCFLVEVGFLSYLKLCKPIKEKILSLLFYRK
jgi:hypothetical protein